MKNKQQKSKGGFSVFLAALCIVIYLFALIQAAVRIYFSIDECRETAEKEFNSLTFIAINAASQGFMNDRFAQTINSAFMSSKTLEAVIITGPNEDLAFEKQKGRAIEWVQRTPRFIYRLSFSKEPYYYSLSVNDIRNANIKAVASLFNFDEISRILKQTLLLILIGFGISFFTMLIEMLAGFKTSEKNFTYVHPPMPAAHSAPAPAAAPQNSFQNAAAAAPQNPFQNAAAAAPVNASERREPSNQEETGPKGLYSARTNMGWEEYTKDRLDSEIHRCASGEKDLTFMMIEFSNAIQDAVFKNIAEEAAGILSSKDMLFEYGGKGFCAILPGADINAAIGKSEKFYQRIQQNHPEVDLNIGITSRSGRLLNADRLMLESREALHKAKNEPSTSIIAFKSDPDKYRKFISQQG